MKVPGKVYEIAIVQLDNIDKTFPELIGCFFLCKTGHK